MAAKARQPAEGAHEHILRQIAGVLVIADEPVTQLIDLTTVTLDNQVERLGPASQRQLDERGLAELREPLISNDLAVLPNNGHIPF